MTVAEVDRHMLDAYPASSTSIGRSWSVYADMCATTGRVVSRQTEYHANVTRAVLQACIAACRSCGDECERHGDHGMEHCRVCAAECHGCEQACQDPLAAIG